MKKHAKKEESELELKDQRHKLQVQNPQQHKESRSRVL
jgi:hypothetical protein